MFIQLDMNSSQAIYDQIVEQVKFAIAAGAVQVNELIPSVRELAKEIVVNPNTIARSYRILQEQGIVYSKRGLGLAVAEDSEKRCREERLEIFRHRFDRLFEEARRSRLSPEEISRLIESLGGRTLENSAEKGEQS